MTTPPVDDPETLRRILGQAEALFLDFDGPVCNLFAGLPASAVVDQLCVVLADGGYGDPPPEIEKSSDPFDVLKYSATLGQTEADYVNAAFAAHEVEAVSTARPTQHAHDLIRGWSHTGRPLAIVSNNSAIAIEAYLDQHHLGQYVSYVSGRVSANTVLLKPNPYLLRRASVNLRLLTNTTTFVGDSRTDIDAARSAQLQTIGYANKPAKVQVLSEAGATLVVTSLGGLRELYP